MQGEFPHSLIDSMSIIWYWHNQKLQKLVTPCGWIMAKLEELLFLTAGIRFTNPFRFLYHYWIC